MVRILLEVVGNIVVDLLCRFYKRVLGMTHELERLASVRNRDSQDDDSAGQDGEALRGDARHLPDEQAFQHHRNQERERNGDDKVVTRLQIIVIREKGCIARGPKDQCGDERVIAHPAEASAREENGGQGQRIEDGAHPHAVLYCAQQDVGKVFARDARVGIGAEEVTVVEEEVWPDKDEEVQKPKAHAERCGRKPHSQKSPESVADRGEQQPCDGWDKEDGGSFGQNHQGKQKAQRQNRKEIPMDGSEGGGRPRLSRRATDGAKGLGREEGQKCEQNEQRLKNRKPRKDEAEGICSEQKNRRRSGQRGLRSVADSACDENPRCREDTGEDGDRECPGPD